MLSNKNHSDCAFGEQIVSYIYDEATAKERTQFESHLPNCLTCADEISGFGLVRSSIVEWRKDEFFTSDAPALKIPANLAPTVSSQNDSWLDEFRKLFSVSPAWASGFAATIISVGLIWLFFGSPQKDLIADKSVGIPSVSPIIPAKQSEQVPDNSQIEKVADKPRNEKEIEQKSIPQQNQIVKTAKTTSKLKSVSPRINNAVAENKPNKKSGNVQKQTTPTLSGMSEEEDDSLRLAELFDEIGSK